MENYTTPFKTQSVAFNPSGIFFGIIQSVSDKRLDIKIPRITGDAVFKNIEYSDSGFTDTPSAGELVFVSFLEGKKDDLVVLGRVKSSLDQPDVDLSGATSGDFLQYDGTKFIAANIDLGSLTVGNYVATIAGTASEIDVSGSGVEGATITLSLPATINADTTGSAAKWTNSRTITLAGDLTGDVTIDGSANATLTATVAANSVALSTDTTGDYVSTITAGTNMSISAGSGTGEGSTPTLATSTTPSFSTITSTVATGTSPLTIASETLVTNLNADRLDGEHGSWYSPSGLISPYAGLTAPAGWLFCNGQSVSRTTYNTLFSTLTATVGTCIITTASPAVVSLTAHGLVEGDAIYFTTTGALPTGLTANITYYVKYVGVDSFQVSLARTSAAAVDSGPTIAAGTAVNTTVAGSGTHTVIKAPHGVSNASTFLVPDFRGQVPVGIDNIGGTDAGVMGISNALGAKAGEVKHTLAEGEMPSHLHGISFNTGNGGSHAHTAGSYDGSYRIDNYGAASGSALNALAVTPGASSERIGTNTVAAHVHNVIGDTATKGSSFAHNVMQPFVLVNYIIKT
jgi:microcystin-dependent protein